MIQQSYSRFFILVNWNQNLDKICTPMFTETLFTIVRYGGNLYDH